MSGTGGSGVYGSLTQAQIGALGHPGYRSGAYYGPILQGAVGVTSAMTADVLYLFPLPVLTAGVFSGVSIRIGTSVPGVSAKLGLYANSSNTFDGPKTLIEQCVAAVDMGATSGDTLDGLFAANRTLPNAFYWGGVIFNGAAQPNTMAQAMTYGGGLAHLMGASSMAGLVAVTANVIIRTQQTAGAAYTSDLPTTTGALTMSASNPGSPILGLKAA